MTSTSPRLWLATPSVVSLQLIAALQEKQPPALLIANARALRTVTEPIETADPAAVGQRTLPDGTVLQLATSEAGLTFDYCDIGYRLVSARLRAVLDLAANEAQLLPVDTAGCPPAVRDTGYQWLHLTHIADPFDHERSDGSYQEVYTGPLDQWRPGAPTVRRWRLRPPAPNRPMRVRWRDGFVPPAPLFQVAGVPWTLATDALAARVRAAGIDDLIFRDVTAEAEAVPYYLLNQ